jgi:Tfp pilus assembly protein PilE
MPHVANRAIVRALAHAARDTGDTMIEVVIAALIVALIAAATFTAFGAVSSISGAQRHQEQAAALAEQDEFRLRSLNSIELVASSPASGCTATTPGSYGNVCYTQTLDGESYTVTSASKFVSASGGTSSCSQSGTGSADFIETSSKVTWNGSNDGRPPVIVHSLISPNAGGALILQDVDSNNNPLAGVTVTITGPSPSTSTTTLTTDSSGCAVFSGLNGGIYNITESDTGYLTENGVTTQSQDVVAGESVTGTKFTWGSLGAITASFQTFVNSTTPTPLAWDTFSLTDTGNAVSPEPGPFGTVGVGATSLTSTQTVYPTTYTAWSGTCTQDDPGGSTGTTGTTGASGTYVDPTVTVAPAGTGTVTVTVPTMLLGLSTQHTSSGTNTPVDDTNSAITYYSGSSTHAGSSGADGNWNYETLGSPYTYYQTTAHYDGTANDKVEFTFTGNFVQWYEPTSYNYGYANAAIYSGGQPASGSPVAGTSVTNIDGYSAVASDGSTAVYSETLSTTGTYTLVITVDGTDDGKASSGNHQHYVVVDEIIWGTGGGTTTSALALSPLPYTVKTYDSCTTAVSRTAPAPITPITAGSSTVYPVQAPYGSSVQVCFANTSTNTNTGALPSTGAQISNTNLNGTTVTPLTLPTTTGATGASAVFNNSGACP